MTDRAPTPEPSEEAMNAWYAKYDGGSDRPHVSVHRPTSLPNCYVHTIHHGGGLPDTLPKGPPQCNLYIGGVTFSMSLEDARLMIAAAAEAIEYAAYCIADLEAARPVGVPEQHP